MQWKLTPLCSASDVRTVCQNLGRKRDAYRIVCPAAGNISQPGRTQNHWIASLYTIWSALRLNLQGVQLREATLRCQHLHSCSLHPTSWSYRCVCSIGISSRSQGAIDGLRFDVCVQFTWAAVGTRDYHRNRLQREPQIVLLQGKNSINIRARLEPNSIPCCV